MEHSLKILDKMDKPFSRYLRRHLQKCRNSKNPCLKTKLKNYVFMIKKA